MKIKARMANYSTTRKGLTATIYLYKQRNAFHPSDNAVITYEATNQRQRPPSQRLYERLVLVQQRDTLLFLLEGTGNSTP